MTKRKQSRQAQERVGRRVREGGGKREAERVGEGKLQPPHPSLLPREENFPPPPPLLCLRSQSLIRYAWLGFLCSSVYKASQTAHTRGTMLVVFPTVINRVEKVKECQHLSVVLLLR